MAVKMSLGPSPPIVPANLCVDIVADFTICDNAFIKAYFGKDTVQHLTKPDRIPKLWCSDGQTMKLICTH
jgi:hypothetical protein